MPTLFFVDMSRWQPPDTDMTRIAEAGFSAINIQLNGSRGYVSGPEAKQYATRARAARLGVCTYAWLDNRSGGAAQARASYDRIRAVGGPEHMAHMVDCEDTIWPATWAIWRDYVSAMQDILQRHVLCYTGRWWWHPRWEAARKAGRLDWQGVVLTPYLCAAPNLGYLKEYPGDASSHWSANYGGWQNLSGMQYAVTPIAPYTVNFSKSAIRDRRTWFALTGEDYPMHAPDAQMPAGKQLVETRSGERVMTSVAPDHPLPPQDPDAAMDAERGRLEKYAGAEKPDPWEV